MYHERCNLQLVAAVAVCAYIIFGFSVIDLDLLFQIRLGLDGNPFQNWSILERISIPLSGSTQVNFGWLAQDLFAEVWILFGQAGLFWLRALAICGIVGLILKSAGPGGIFALLVVSPLIATNSTLRPQLLVLVLYAILLAILSTRVFSQRRAIIIAVFIPPLWHAIHSSLPLGIAVVMCSLIDTGILALLVKKVRAFFSSTDRSLNSFTIGSNSQAASLVPGLVFILSAALTLLVVPPSFPEVWQMMIQNKAIARDLLQVSEWMPSWHPSVFEAVSALVIVGPLLLVAVGRGSICRPFRLACLGLFIASIFSARIAVFFALTVVPCVAPFFVRSFPKGVALASRRINAAVPLLITIIGLGYAALASRVVFKREGIPAAQIRTLADNLEVRRIYNYREWSGPLALLGRRDWQLFIDGRLYLYDKASWQLYDQIARGDLGALEAEDFDALFLHPSYHAALIEAVSHSSHWREQREPEGQARIFSRVR